MNKTFEDSYRLRAADFDRWSNLRPASVMDLFQDIAGRHANELGVGMNALFEKKIAWVIVKLRFRILKPCRMYDSVRVRTWPLPPDRIGYRREYLISNADGEAVAEGSSEWVLMDFESRRIVPGGNIYPLTEYCMDTAFPERFPRTRSFDADGPCCSIIPPWSDFDVNGHVNNTKYANYVLDTIVPDENEHISALSMEYHREVLPGEELNILTCREGSTVLARGESSSGEKMFSCRIEFEAN